MASQMVSSRPSREELGSGGFVEGEHARPGDDVEAGCFTYAAVKNLSTSIFRHFHRPRMR